MALIEKKLYYLMVNITAGTYIINFDLGFQVVSDIIKNTLAVIADFIRNIMQLATLISIT